MTYLETIIASALGQLVAITVVVVAWTIWNLWLVIKTFTQAAWRTRIEIVCSKKE